MAKKDNIILQAITGSHAYGLATSESDLDYLGVFVTPTWELLRLSPPKDTIVSANPDRCLHEVGKFIRLALKANPTIIELLFMPKYEVITEAGRLLVEHRSAFLSQMVSASYGGYAVSQIRKMMKRGDGEFSSKRKGRYPKHARHCFRLLQQGTELLRIGELTVPVTDPEALLALGELSPEELSAIFEEEFARFKAVESVLPAKPNYELLNDVLLQIRKMYL